MLRLLLGTRGNCAGGGRSEDLDLLSWRFSTREEPILVDRSHVCRCCGCGGEGLNLLLRLCGTLTFGNEPLGEGEERLDL